MNTTTRTLAAVLADPTLVASLDTPNGKCTRRHRDGRAVFTAPNGSTHSVPLNDPRTDVESHWTRFAQNHGADVELHTNVVSGELCDENDGTFVFQTCEFSKFAGRLLRVVDTRPSVRTMKVATFSKRSRAVNARQTFHVQPQHVRFATAAELREFNAPLNSEPTSACPVRPLAPLDPWL